MKCGNHTLSKFCIGNSLWKYFFWFNYWISSSTPDWLTSGYNLFHLNKTDGNLHRAPAKRESKIENDGSHDLCICQKLKIQPLTETPALGRPHNAHKAALETRKLFDPFWSHHPTTGWPRSLCKGWVRSQPWNLRAVNSHIPSPIPVPSPESHRWLSEATS